MSNALDVIEPPKSEPPKSGLGAASHQSDLRVTLVGNPNVGKTSLFNRLTGLRATTANFPGTTVEHRRGKIRLNDQPATLIDLPGLYSLDAVTPDERVAAQTLEGALPGQRVPDAVLVVIDATNLERNLFLLGQVLDKQLPTIVALNMIDTADRQGLRIQLAKLREELSCPVVAVSARTGQGIPELIAVLENVLTTPAGAIPTAVRTLEKCSSCEYAARYDWAESVAAGTVSGDGMAHGQRTEAIDRWMTHRVWGLVAFGAVMLLTFVLIFWIAQYPMDMIDGFFALAGETVGTWLPAGDFRSFVTDGVVAGVGGMLIFLPQICILFFMLALLEGSGYLARAAFVMDRLMRRVGLPGKAFVPMLSAHACAIPAIMASRVIEDRRDRLATILVAPLMSCSARVPVYAMLVALLFPHDPVKASLLFAAAYLLGIATALVMAFVFKKTLLRGNPRPLVIELPPYRLPSLRNALLMTYDRSSVFVKNAGTTILCISLIMWALATYPKTSLEELPAKTQAEIAALQTAGDDGAADALLAQSQLRHSFAGQIGRGLEPVFAPLGFDWKVSVGVVSSFAAREVIVSTLAVLFGVGDDFDNTAEDGESNSLYHRLQSSTHPDGRPVFTAAACLSLLVFYVLAMQCLPTQAITRRETGTWKWPLLQLGYMTALAYVAALVTYQSALAAGLG